MSFVQDPKLAPQGRLNLEIAERHMGAKFTKGKPTVFLSWAIFSL